MTPKNNLLLGWFESTIGETVDIDMGQSPKGTATNLESLGTPLIGGAADLGVINPAISRHTTEPTKICEKDDIILCIRATIGRLNIADSRYCLGRGVAGLHPILLDRNWLKYWLVDHAAKLESKGTGTTFKQINKKIISEYPLLLAPLPEQKRITTKIDALQAKSKKAREALEAARPLLDKLRQSILAAAFRGDLTADWRKQNPDVEPAVKLLESIRIERRQKWEEAELAKMRAKGKEPKNDKWKARYKEPEPVDTTGLPELPEGWCWAGIQQLLAVKRTGMRTGPFGTLLSKSDHVTEGIPVLGIENIGQMAFLEKTKIHITEEKAKDLIQYDALPSDVIISRSGTVGEVCVVPSGIGPAIISTNLIRVALEPDGLRPHFLGHMFTGSPIVQSQITELCSGSSRDFLNQKIMKKLVIPIPPLSEQDAILEYLSTLLSSKVEMEKMFNKGNGELIDLDQSILAKAFRGELVPQDPNDEPAAILLERIKAEREAAKPKKKTRTKKAQGKTK